MILAAIDIGSNAIRLQIIRVIREEDLISFKKLEYLRFPLRLGKDAFEKGAIQAPSLLKFEKLMRAFKLLIELYEVHSYIATATSAMRESSNGKAIVQQIATYFDLKIDIISGADEAGFLSKAIIPHLDDKSYLHIDVGGGSTELNLYINKERIISQSFKLGSVRQLNQQQRKAVFADIRAWINSSEVPLQAPVIAVGTGGNIRQLFKLSRNRKQNAHISLAELKALKAYVSAFTYEQRLNMLKLNPDRADVIIPASEIYISVMEIAGADQVLVPEVGLKDGLLYTLYEQVSQERIQHIQFLGHN